MFKYKVLKIFFSFILTSVIIATEVFDCAHKESISNIEKNISGNWLEKKYSTANFKQSYGETLVCTHTLT